MRRVQHWYPELHVRNYMYLIFTPSLMTLMTSSSVAESVATEPESRSMCVHHIHVQCARGWFKDVMQRNLRFSASLAGMSGVCVICCSAQWASHNSTRRYALHTAILGRIHSTPHKALSM